MTEAATPSRRPANAAIAASADDALRVVRIALGVLSCFVLGAYRPLTEAPRWWSLTAVLVGICVGVLALNLLARRLPSEGPLVWVAQALDVAGMVALAVALDDPLGQQSWVLLVVPVVSAAVRLGSLASVLSWVGGCIGYVLAATAGAVTSTDEVTLLARVPGVLLAVAITVGLLARWMREGWEIQNALTETTAEREHRLAVIEETQHALKDLQPQLALELCANQVLALGFDAATVEFGDSNRETLAVGDADVIARTDGVDDRPRKGPVVTIWTEGDVVRTHSVAVYEPEARAVVTGWATTPIDQDHANAFATLISHTSSAIETSTLLTQLRYNASHDALTGLANRRVLDQELQRRARADGAIAVAFVDLDNFKSINDEHGHDVGDKALAAIAKRLEAASGSDALVARYGGDEFVILLPNFGVDEVEALARAVLMTSESPIAIGPRNVKFGLSVGVAATSTPASAEDVVLVADQAVYQAKAAGRAAIVLVDLDSSDSAARLVRPLSSVPIPVPISFRADTSRPMRRTR